MAYRKFLNGFLFGFITLACLCVATFFLTAGFRSQHAGVGWAPTLIKAKMETLEQAASPKAVIVSGSNGLFGIDAGQLSATLSVPVYNAACFGGVTWPYLDYYALRSLKAGDYAILPLELGYYTNNNTINSATVVTAHAVGLEYFLSLPTEEKISYLQMMTLKFARQQLQERFQPFRTKRTFKYFNYTLQPNGDIDLSQAISLPDAVVKEAQDSVPSEPSPEAMAMICNTVKQLQNRGVRVIFTEQNSYTLEKNHANYRSFMGKVAEAVERCGATFVTVPSEGMLPLEDMLDTHLHPNAEGRRKRTEELAPALCRAGLPCRPDLKPKAASSGEAAL